MKNSLDILFSDEFRRSVEANLDRDPLRIALDRSIPHAAEVATQVKYLDRARRKLPSWYAARCIVPPIAFEQSSGEAAAARKHYSGELAIDLTCGLGVDSFMLSRRFERVVAIERDGELAAIARENFRRLGADNIEVVHASAEEFLSGCAARADLVYADPDRRGADGKKMVRIEDCSPDMAALLLQIERIAPRMVVKLSPMFDVDEVFRIFGSGTIVEVVSLGGECKEIVADVTFGSRAVPVVRAVSIGVGEAEYPVGDNSDDPDGVPDKPAGNPDWPGGAPNAESFAPDCCRYLVVPDVALQKARVARRYLSERDIRIFSDNGYGFATEKPAPGIMVKVFEIESAGPFDPKELKRRLRTHDIRSIDILKREFPLSAADIARALGVREGGVRKIAFTRADGRLWQIVLKQV